MSDLKRSDFDYVLPPELIAQVPLPQRSASRLLLLHGDSGIWRDHRFGELPSLLRPGDLLVFNDTRVIPARLAARKPTGGRIEVFLERALPGARALAQLRDSKSVRPGMRLSSAGGEVRILARQGELWEIELPAEAHAFFERYGRVPLPPYIRRPVEDADRQRYQSVWARVPGAVAAPTASLHFDSALLEALSAHGIECAWLTLHVGAGTFAPIRSEDLNQHNLHSEAFEIGAATVDVIGRAHARGGRVIAVGTTVARALESAAQGAASSAALQPTAGETTLFIRPGFRFRVIDGLLTNFHLPQSTLLMLVAAFAGRAQVLAAYAHAVEAGYRFFSYGDAMLVWPQRPRACGAAE
ncbi:MAG: tRNA preQ1(34) S-adenosylmethionine ribosyltransferase-isomerase QueA [Steroidobacteraceae bacterium]